MSDNYFNLICLFFLSLYKSNNPLSCIILSKCCNSCINTQSVLFQTNKGFKKF